MASAKKHNYSSSLPQTANSGPAGRIIYVSATNHYTGLPLQTHVSVAKAGIDALSNNVAIEYGPLALTSNVIAPGPIVGIEGMDRFVQRSQVSRSENMREEDTVRQVGVDQGDCGRDGLSVQRFGELRERRDHCG